MVLMDVGGELLMYSPVALSSDHIRQINDIGPVRKIFAPNNMHHLFLRPAIEQYPDADIWVADGVIQKVGDISGARVLSDKEPVCSSTLVEQITFSGHKIKETVFYHKASKTLLTCDLLYNIQSQNFLGERLFFKLIRTYGRPKVALYHKFSLPDKDQVREALELMEAWDIRRIVMAHGQIIESDSAGAVFHEAWKNIL